MRGIPRKTIGLVLLITHLVNANEDNVAKTTIATPKGEVLVEIADTEIKRARGLGHRHHLPQGQGMLFVYKAPGYRPIWMKGMNFAIDVLWLNKEKTVTYIVPNFSPKTYRPKGPISHHSPEPDTFYVLELPAGDATRLGINVGTKLSFELPAPK